MKAEKLALQIQKLSKDELCLLFVLIQPALEKVADRLQKIVEEVEAENENKGNFDGC